MNLGKVDHSYLGNCRTYHLMHTRIIQLKCLKNKVSSWFDNYTKYSVQQFEYCLFPVSINDTNEQQFRDQKQKQITPASYRINYEGFYVVSLADQIRTRRSKNQDFKSSEILFILLSVAKAWKQWEDFCIEKSLKTNFAISSDHILLNEEGDIKLITNLSSPLPMPKNQYYSPQNCPPSEETLNSWNRSISFSIGLIGYQMLALQSATSFYQATSDKIKFNLKEYQKWISFAESAILQHQSKFHSDPQIKRVINIVKLLTDNNPWIRLKIGQLHAVLKPEQQKIIDGEPTFLDRQMSHKSLLNYLSTGQK